MKGPVHQRSPGLIYRGPPLTHLDNLSTRRGPTVAVWMHVQAELERGVELTHLSRISGIAIGCECRNPLGSDQRTRRGVPAIGNAEPVRQVTSGSRVLTGTQMPDSRDRCTTDCE
jgi:hypothetical protein